MNIVRSLISEKEITGPSGKPKRQYLYSYRYTGGQKLKPEDVEYVKSLRIPNKINNDSLTIYPKGSKVQFSYLDEKGRSIYGYSKSEIIKNYDKKYRRYRSFAKNHHNIVNQLLRDIHSTDERKAQAALILYIIYKTGLRIGSNADTKATFKAYGISTLLNKHVKLISPNKIIFDFIGKKGVRNNITIRDPLIYNQLKLRKTQNWSNQLFTVTGNYVRQYLGSIDDRYIIKDFRTLKANQEASRLISMKKGPAPTEKIFKKWQSEVAEKVAKKLGNTKNVALNDYIDPKLWNRWRKKEWGEFRPKKFILEEE